MADNDLIFSLPLDPGQPVNLVFGAGSVEAPDVVLPAIEMGHGESVGSVGRQLKDKRSYGDLNIVQNPFSLGLAFSSSSLAVWPSGYALQGAYRHFYSGNYGTQLKTAEIESLVLPGYVLTDVFGGDEVAVPVYAATPGVLGGATGESLGVIVGIVYAGVGFAVGTSESHAVVVTNDKQFAVDANHGQSLAVDLKIESTVTTAGTGESVALTLDVYDLMPIRQYVGESLEAALATLPVLQMNLGHGESQSAAAEFHPTSYFTMAWASGESQSPITLITQSALSIGLSTGETHAVTTLTVPPRTGFDFAASVGESFGASLSTALNLGDVFLCEGQTVAVTALGEDPPYRFGAGESMSVGMGVVTAIPMTFHTGESSTRALDTRPPAFLRADLFAGASISYLSMEVQYRATFHCAMHDGTYVTATEQTSTTTYDLADPVLYVDTLDWLVDMNAFEFMEMRPSFQYNKGAGILVTVDLQCRPAFSIGFATGESWRLEANSRYLAVDLTAPTAAIYPSEFFYVEPRINLCYPNVFPDADAMEVELDFTDDSCYADYMFAGQSMAMALSARHQMTVGGVSVGESFAFDITLVQPWRVNFAVGTRMDFYLATDIIIRPVFPSGESLKATFEETSIEFVTGESVVATLHTTFDVEFLERGCLDNEYRYLKPDGFEDVEKFNPVAVELEPFAHDIKARCF